ncbi:MerR family transcriptional regulator [Niallia taxi]|uniref:MerR family transcriptional regulator n=1 Tax=Niallia TaxID=2837506 RepID=UPI00203E2604|nr:MerR family transcriptional regulator [Niallia sp. MER 6]MCM3033570.1 MerR family transcriptional regulator [Niallia sp. MER 6]
MYTIKQASKLTGLTIDTIRYYEKAGLLPKIKRLPNGHRAFSSSDIERLQMVICMKKVNLSLEEIKLYLDITESSNMIPEMVTGMLEHKEKIKQQMAQLQTVLDFIDEKLAEGTWLKKKA